MCCSGRDEYLALLNFKCYISSFVLWGQHLPNRCILRVTIAFFFLQSILMIEIFICQLTFLIEKIFELKIELIYLLSGLRWLTDVSFNVLKEQTLLKWLNKGKYMMTSRVWPEIFSWLKNWPWLASVFPP